MPVLMSLFGSHYYYTFLDSKIDDLSNILTESFGRNPFKLEIPSKGKALPLYSENKDIKCFFTRDDIFFSREFQNELFSYRDNRSKDVRRSGVNPSYCIVPLELKDMFKRNHRILFSSLFYHGDVAIVHKDSRSFLEIEEYTENTKKAKSKEEEITTIRVLKNAFETTDYKRETYIMDKFVKHVQSNYEMSEKLKTSGYYCSMIAILQSSGYGKSKLMEKLGSRTPTFYSSLLQGSGFPSSRFSCPS